MNRLLFSVVLVLGLVGGAMASELQRQHGAHVHGQASGTLALDVDRLHLELDIPGANLVGFEHPPRTDAQAEALATLIRALEDGQWLVADARGQCEISEIKVRAAGFGLTDDHGHKHDHADGHDHHHGHKRHHDHESSDHHGHDHAEFHLVALLECQAPGQLRWLDISLFDDYPGNEQLTIDVLTETLATRARLSPGRQRIDLDS